MQWTFLWSGSDVCRMSSGTTDPMNVETHAVLPLTATADGLGIDEETVQVEADECHVISEAVVLTLPVED